MTGGPATAGVLGLTLGLGVVLIWRAIAQRPTAIGVSLRRLDDVGTSVATLDRSPRSRRERLQGLGSRHVSGRARRELAIAGRTLEQHGLEKVTCALLLGAVPSLMVALLRAGGVGVTAVFAVVGAPVGCVTGFVIPDLTLRSRAADRRRAFRYALSAYLDLVNVLLAGGAGVETALAAAAEAGDGWAFDHLRQSIVRARSTRSSPWTTLAELGRFLGVQDLVELAANVELAGEQGARIRTSLMAKAQALRGRHAAEVEAEANAATERMGVPTVVMFIGFLVLLGYPAAVTVMGGIGG